MLTFFFFKAIFYILALRHGRRFPCRSSDLQVLFPVVWASCSQGFSERPNLFFFFWSLLNDLLLWKLILAKLIEFSLE